MTPFVDVHIRNSDVSTDRGQAQSVVRVRSSALLFSHDLQAERGSAMLCQNACLVRLTATVPQPGDCQPELRGFTKMVVAGSTPSAQARLGNSAPSRPASSS